MTRDEFIAILDWKEYSYGIEGDKIVVTEEDQDIFLSHTSIPPDVVFNNVRDVWLNSLTSLPPGVEFRNRGRVYLWKLKTLPPDVVFRNGGYVNLIALTSLPPGVVFNNLGDVALNSLVGGWFENWKGNIEGIDSKRLLNLMIKQGVFI